MIYFKKDRPDRAALIRTFMFLGFGVMAPNSPLVPLVGDVMFLTYHIERDEDEEDDGDFSDRGDF
jgi:ornithine decarboxylase antizyme 1